MYRIIHSRRRWLKSVSGIIVLGCTSISDAQQPPSDAPVGEDGDTVGAVPNESSVTGGPQATEWQTNSWRFGVSVSSTTASLDGVHATFTLPRNWPEQKIRIAEQSFSPYVVGSETRNVLDMATQLVLQMNRIPPGSLAEAIVTCEVQKAKLVPPEPIGIWKIPKRPDKSLRMFLTSSPYIDPSHSKIKKAAVEVASEGLEDGWALVERTYDWVREKVSYREGDIKTATQALDDGAGDCEELTSVFVAILRANRVPSRMVWVPGHAYPEFYLENEAGVGAWFPCQVAGNREFGGMTEARPILQKGDRFKVPEQKDIQRYLAEFCKIDAVRGTGKPKVRFISEKVF